ncbi:MAG: hypothetical protein FJY85_14825 [Deltaproteobacteria bacterium]|nr:hypothetical protein [Deltaproteobacteria bacterium]
MGRTTTAMAVLLSLVAGSCITFEKQTATFHYDTQRDKLLIFQVYEGIYGNTNKESLDETEINEMTSVLEGERTFFFSNWISEYDRAAVERLVKDLAVEAEQKDAKPEVVKAKQEALALAKLILENAKVENGRFYMNSEQKLSGYQFVTLNNASKVVAQANLCISAAVKAHPFADKPGENELSVESAHLLRTAASKAHAWITLDGSCIRARMPLAYGDFLGIRKDWWAQKIEKAMAKAESREQEMARVLREAREFLLSDIWVSYVDHVVEITLGDPSSRRATVSSTLPDSAYKPNAIAFARERHGIAESVDLEKLKSEFFGPSGAPQKQSAQ